MPRVPLALASILLSLSPRRLRALFATFGAPASVEPPIDLDSPLAVLRALFARALPAALVDALDEIARIATIAIGRDAILEAAWDLGIDTDAGAWATAPAADLAAWLLCARARGDANARAVLERVRIRIGRHLAPYPWYELSLSSPVGDPTALLVAAAHAVHGASFVDATAVLGDDGKTRAAILHRAPPERDAVLLADGSVARRTRRRILCDLAEWDPHASRVAFVLPRCIFLSNWASALGLGDRSTFTLKPLHERGATWLARAKLPPDARRVTVVACELDDGVRLGARSENALAELHARLAKTEGYLWRATLRLELAGVLEPVDTTIELPNKLFIADARYAAPVRAAIAALGLSSPGATPDDLSSLGLLAHDRWRFAAIASDAELAQAAAKKVLVRVPSRRPAEARHRRWGSMFVAHNLEGGAGHYAATDDMSVRAHTVTSEALARWKVDDVRLAEELRERMVLESPKTVRDVPAGVLPIGILRTKGPSGGRICFSLLLSVVREDAASTLAKRIRRSCKGMHAVVLVGEGRTLGGAIEEVEVTVAQQLGVGEMAGVVVSAATQVGLAKKLEPWRLGSEDKPLVLLVGEGVAYLGRIKLRLTSNQFALLVGLAADAGEWVTSGTLGTRISAHAAFPDVIVRKALADLNDRVRESANASGVALKPEWADKLVLSEKKSGYRLGVGVVVVE